MHRLAIALVAIASLVASVSFFVSPATAADAPLKAPIYKAPLFDDWSGPYAGIVGGYGWGHSKQTDDGICSVLICGGLTFDGSYDMRGGMLGGALGWNWQSGPWVFGLEGDFSWANISGSSDVCGATTAPFAHPCGTKLESLGTLRGRLGYALGANGNWLIYVTGGLAGGEVKAWDDFTPAAGSAFRWGYAVGGGIEAGLTPTWRARAEYLYVDLGNKDMFDVVPGLPENVSFAMNTIRLGLFYRFAP